MDWIIRRMDDNSSWLAGMAHCTSQQSFLEQLGHCTFDFAFPMFRQVEAFVLEFQNDLEVVTTTVDRVVSEHTTLTKVGIDFDE